MEQKTLFDTQVKVKKADFDGIKAVFTEVVDGVYDVILEINSQKFLVRMASDLNSISSFEVLAIKGFVYDLTSNLILTLKNLTQCLRVNSQ